MLLSSKPNNFLRQRQWSIILHSKFTLGLPNVSYLALGWVEIIRKKLSFFGLSMTTRWKKRGTDFSFGNCCADYYGTATALKPLLFCCDRCWGTAGAAETNDRRTWALERDCKAPFADPTCLEENGRRNGASCPRTPPRRWWFDKTARRHRSSRSPH